MNIYAHIQAHIYSFTEVLHSISTKVYKVGGSFSLAHLLVKLLLSILCLITSL